MSSQGAMKVEAEVWLDQDGWNIRLKLPRWVEREMNNPSLDKPWAWSVCNSGITSGDPMANLGLHQVTDKVARLNLDARRKRTKRRPRNERPADKQQQQRRGGGAGTFDV